jgi:hypothetical protein
MVDVSDPPIEHASPAEVPSTEAAPVEVAPVEVAPVEPGAPTVETPRWHRFEKLLPWLSMAISIAGALLMDRHESRATWVAGASAASWIFLVGVVITHRPRGVQDGEGRLVKAVRFSTVMANQSLVHVSLFFCGPLYARVFSWTFAECVFASLFGAALLISLWDPLCSAVLRHPAFGPLLLAFSSFVGWNAVLPMLGVPHRIGVWASAAAVSFFLPLVHFLAGSPPRYRAGALVVALLLPLALLAGGVRALPPAPLRMVTGAIGTRVVERTLVDPTRRFERAPAALVCFTAIQAPLGLKDELVHEWRHDGEITHRIALDVRGGRRAGFRTWSRVVPPRGARGKYRCAVMTTLGQTVGVAEAVIGD